ncbi:uncharacterized protein ColSpa_10845 [Colletotrichum spaethianum]|uniref:Uncharacterized protein n=1 Tax=Colletotrichum spaethianum TaxID=700344 RepID=A0AA37PED4_9PEZI|nr:uncharacterized protein ColSpa_10845 [Colletotrichum spaethianum]GKT50664.1 hypothetical protein ColSpa_10845 [Colletotrichum spaethianum]
MISNIPTDQSSSARQPSIAASSSRPNTPPIGDYRLKDSETGTEPEGSFITASDGPEIEHSEENDDVTDVNYDELETLEHKFYKRMYADRKNRLMEIYHSRIGSKIQHGRSRKARKLAQRRRLSQDEKRQMN